ncbi:hypothetical protein DN730_05410 [Marinomonas piezotolerans]|uniref:Tetratricopeptide repeat protein n=1 Tax=Marinomonas piezotolerans TaxID=2213058 RepID=A0A370UBI1_9GAMM|nr:hypothetical protein [Marinomonas piezotolerans]RDL45055.1 hypothetical protein DN730_05410 [Marinomonas piezotolerans]
MELWKQEIALGNQVFQQGDHLTALQHYQNASDRARQLLDCWFDTEAAISALVVSGLNHAETQCRLGEFEAAIETYATLSLDLRRFQNSFAPSNPIVMLVSESLLRIKREFLTLTQTYAYDILKLRSTKAL